MEITGKLIKKDIPTTGMSKAGKPWNKQGFVIETEEQYPKKVFIETMSDKVIEALENYSAGYKMTVSINIESREYNERWYTSISAWNIIGDESNKPSVVDATHQNESSDDLPF